MSSNPVLDKFDTYMDYLETEVRLLRTGIRQHRDQKGDDRCWLDDYALYGLLPEGFIPPPTDSAPVDVELEQCKLFLKCRKDPNLTYISPQRRIDELEETVKNLQQQVERLKFMKGVFDGQV